jgi:hypothetical protein
MTHNSDDEGIECFGLMCIFISRRGLTDGKESSLTRNKAGAPDNKFLKLLIASEEVLVAQLLIAILLMSQLLMVLFVHSSPVLI